MQQFFQDLQVKLWAWSVQAFEKALAFSNETWNQARPCVELSLERLEKMFAYLSSSFSYAFSLLGDQLTWLLKKSAQLQPAFKSIYQQNIYAATAILIAVSSVLIFWIYMIMHVKKNEVFHKQLWKAVVVFLGPIGALIYYIFRKRKLEKERDRQDKVMMSFFSPMNDQKEK